jgi:quinohemoprotein ethanol dehydrogenase
MAFVKNGKLATRLAFSALFIGASACSLIPPASAATLVDGSAIADEVRGANWLSYGRTYSEARYSPLSGINDHNISQLGLAWFLDLPDQRTLEATPLAVDGILYFSGTYGRTFAVDARSGKELWEFDPDLAHHIPQKMRLNMGANRGVAYWKGKVYVGTNDGRLLALDARTGGPVWSVETVDAKSPKFISGAPRVFNGKVIIGHGTAEAGSRGYVTAYNAETGRQLWRFYLIPGDPGKGFASPAMAMAAKTWSGRWRNWGGGAVWDTIVYDPEFNRVYLATGNGNSINAEVRSPGGGNNLFVCSIVALDADTGRYVWHYQINPRDSWDYDSTQQITLADLVIAGTPRKVLMQAPKNGFFYVIDRNDGKLISAQKFVKATWAERIDIKTGRPVETANLHYESGPVVIWPSSSGAHSWQSMSFNPVTGLVYIPITKLAMKFGPLPHPQASNPDTDFKGSTPSKQLYAAQVGADLSFVAIDPDDGTGGLLAWDPVAQSKRWEVHYDSFWNGGTLTTAGNLVFQGTGRGQFIAYDARTGAKLWSFDAGLGILAAPISYQVDGVQHVSVLVGYGGQAGLGGKLFDSGWRFNEQPRRLLTFALRGNSMLPPGKPPRFKVSAVDDPAMVIDLKQAARGAAVYGSNYCALCHGINLENTGSIAPDLRESSLALNWSAFRSVLHEGVFTAAGMPTFDDLSDEDIRAVFMYVRQQARQAARSSP